MASFCPECGAGLETREAFGKPRRVCSGCGRVHFDDPKVAVGVVVQMDGGIVLGKRNHDPKMGAWSFPSGFVDAGEVVEEAARRECEEETGLEVSIDKLLGVFSTAGDRVVFVAFAGSVVGGKLEAGEECTEVGVFAADRLPDLAFPYDDAILQAWADYRAGVV